MYKKNKYALDWYRIIAVMILCLFGLCVMTVAFAQEQKPAKKPSAQQDDRVYLVHSDELYYDMHGANPDAQIVKGNVQFKHKGGRLTCDSAYFYQQLNSVRAMGNVRFKQGDTLSLACGRGYYDGQTQMMEARANVVLKHKGQTLYTDSLNYDRIWQNAYFYDGGKLVDGEQQLVADWGTYNTTSREAVFYYNVVLLGDKQRVETDTLYYNTHTSMAHVVGPSKVIQDSIIVETTDGYFSNKTHQSQLFGRSTIINGQKSITGDSLYYDKETGDAEGYGNVIYTDTVNKNALHGDYVYYNEQQGYGYATNRALVKEYSQGDTLYMHSDTIKLYTFNINTDSVYRMVHCYNNVRAYRSDLQAICDSLVGDSRDSCMTMYHNPVVWNGDRQILGEIIKVYAADSTIREAHVEGQALSVEKCDDEGHYNQISARKFDAYFTDGELRRIDATGNVRVIFYPVEEKDSTLMLLNYTETDTMRVYFAPGRELEKIWTSKHNSDMYPMSQIPPDKYKLSQFAWFEELRPKSSSDVFTAVKRDEDTKLKKEERMQAPLQKLPLDNE